MTINTSVSIIEINQTIPELTITEPKNNNEKLQYSTIIQLRSLNMIVCSGYTLNLPEIVGQVLQVKVHVLNSSGI
jgi:hypothetical protein